MITYLTSIHIHSIMIRIQLNASELAVITGHNRWKDPTEVGEQILIRNHLKRGTLIKNDIQKTVESIKDEKVLNDIKKELKLPENTTKKELEKHIQKAFIEPALKASKEGESHTQQKKLLEKTPLTQQLFKKAAHSDLIKKRGNVKEDEALNRSEVKNKTKITKRNTKMYIKSLYKDDDLEINLCGKVDGVQNEETVVESKNRSKRLFMKIPIYEKVQLEAYMFLTGFKKALHIENYNETSHEIVYEQDEVFWNECKETIIEFVQSLIAE